MSRLTTCALVALTAVLLIMAAGIAFAAEAPAPPKIDVHGYMQNRVYMGSGANTQFRSERISISTIANFADNSNAYVELYYHPWAPASGLYLESAYYDKAIGKGRLRIGKGRRLTFGITPAYPNRRTSNYGIVAEAVTQDRMQGIQYTTSNENMDFGLSLHTAYRLGTRAAGEIPGDSVRNAMHQVTHLCLRDDNANLSQNLAVSTRIGVRSADGFTAGVSGSWSKLDARDLTTLTTLKPVNPLTGLAAIAPLVGPTTDDSFSQWGIDFTKKWDSGFVLQGEYYGATASTLDYSTWNLEGGYYFPSGWKAFVRYSKKDMDTPATDNPLSWDLTQTSISVVQPIAKSVWIQYEYEINEENAPCGDCVGNNIFFVELFSGF